MHQDRKKAGGRIGRDDKLCPGMRPSKKVYPEDHKTLKL